jgi:Wadjet anti plasmid transformation system JetA-like protein
MEAIWSGARLFGDGSAETRLVEILRCVDQIQPWHAELWDDLAELYVIRTSDELSLYTEPRRGAPVAAQPLKESSISEERRRILVQWARDELAQRITRDKTFDLACRLLKGRHRVDLGEVPLANDTELLQLIYLHAYRKDTDGPYEIIGSDDAMELIWKRDYGFRPGSLEHRNGSPKKRSK